MSIGPATIMAIIAAALATLLWWLAARLALPAWVGQFLFGAGAGHSRWPVDSAAVSAR